MSQFFKIHTSFLNQSTQCCVSLCDMRALVDKGNSLMSVLHIQPHGHGSVDAIIKKAASWDDS